MANEPLLDSRPPVVGWVIRPTNTTANIPLWELHPWRAGVVVREWVGGNTRDPE